MLPAHALSKAYDAKILHMLMWVISAAEPAFLQSVIDKGERLRSGLAEALKGNEHVKEIRGLGLITGIQLDQVSLQKPL